MKILGLDISTKTGVSVMSVTSDGIQHNTWELEYKNLRGLERVLKFYEWITAYLLKEKPELIVLEGYGYANAHTLVLLVEIGTAIRLAGYQAGIPMVNVAPSMLKKFCTGGGDAKKEQILLEVFKKWGFSAKTNNEGDAYVLARIGLLVEGAVAPTNAYEREMLVKLKKE